MTTDERKRFAAESLRRLAEQIEADKWGEVFFEVTAEHHEKPRFSWQPYQGVDLVGQEVRLRLMHPKRGT